MKKLVIVAGLALMVPVSAQDSNFNPNFSLKNKSGKEIWVNVKVDVVGRPEALIVPSIIKNDKNEQLKQGPYFLDSGQKVEDGQSLALELPDGANVQAVSAGSYIMDISYAIDLTKGVNARYTFPFELKNRSTYYVKFYMNKSGTEALLEPQKGRFGKTTEGYSLKKNIRLPKGKNSLVTKEKRV